jgi:hypothetical protein
MASPARIQEAIVEIFKRLDKGARAKTRSDAATLEKTLGKTQAEDIPTSDVIPTTPPTDPALKGTADVAAYLRLVRRGAGPVTKKGSGPSVITERGSAPKFDIGEEGVRPKQFLDALEVEMDKLSTQVPLDELEAIATKNVEAAFEAASPKRKFKSVQERKRVQRGRKAAIARGEQKYMPKGSVKYTSRYDEPPAAFGETSEFASGEASLGVPREVKDLMDEAVGPVSKVRQQKRIKPGKETMDAEEAAEQLDDLLGNVDYEAKRISDIQDELGTDPFLRTLGPKLQEDVARDILIPSSTRYKRVDEIGGELFGKKNKEGEVTLPGKIPELESALAGGDISKNQAFQSFVGTRQVTTPPPRSEAELVQLGQSGKQLGEFRKLAAQVIAAAKEANLYNIDTGVKPNINKVINIIKRMPPGIRKQLRPAYKEGTLAEALTDLAEQILRRTEQPAKVSLTPKTGGITGGGKLKKSAEEFLLDTLKSLPEGLERGTR